MDQNNNIITKAIYTANVDIDGINAAIPTTEISVDELERRRDQIEICPTQFQSRIDKKYELRVTVVGQRVFAVKIDTQATELTKVDWRVHADLCPHSVYELPMKIHDFCLRFLKEFDLDYGAFDFIVDGEGEYVFLENNPFGQYLWLELETDLPITEEIIRLLKSRQMALKN